MGITKLQFSHNLFNDFFFKFQSSVASKTQTECIGTDLSKIVSFWIVDKNKKQNLSFKRNFSNRLHRFQISM